MKARRITWEQAHKHYTHLITAPALAGRARKEDDFDYEGIWSGNPIGPVQTMQWDDEIYNVMTPLPGTDPIRFENEWSGWTLRRKASKENN